MTNARRTVGQRKGIQEGPNTLQFILSRRLVFTSQTFSSYDEQRNFTNGLRFSRSMDWTFVLHTMCFFVI